MKLTVLALTYEIDKEWERTLYTLENQLPSAWSNIDIVRLENRSPSPLALINEAATEANKNDILLILPDGARMLSPGIFRKTYHAFCLFQDPFVYTLCMHIGHDHQSKWAGSLEHNIAVSDALLESVDWRKDGYELFRISCLAGSSTQGFWKGASESTCFAVRASSFPGYDERFTSPGGGFSNIDFFARAQARHKPVSLLGEASFHQYHGGVSSNTAPGEGLRPLFEEEYEHIMGTKRKGYFRQPYYLGNIPQQAEAVFCG